jgi:hypothetical protein
MKGICLIIPLIVLLTSTASAQSARSGKAQRSAVGRTYNTPLGKPRFGADPDANIRFEEMRQYNWRKGGS